MRVLVVTPLSAIGLAAACYNSLCLLYGLQILVDPETFKGIHARLSELGGVVLEAVEKMSQAYFSCKSPSTMMAEYNGMTAGELKAMPCGCQASQYLHPQLQWT